MLGLLWERACQATLLKLLVDHSAARCLFLPNLWLGIASSRSTFVPRAVHSILCLRNVEAVYQAASYVPFSLGDGTITRVQAKRNDFYYGCLEDKFSIWLYKASMKRAGYLMQGQACPRLETV